MDFLPTTREELIKLKIGRPDIIIVTGDAYIDSPFIGAAVIGRYLWSKGFTVAIIAQPAMDRPDDITRLGEPNLFWGVTGGSIDSMVANYTPMKKFRNSDDLTPGGVNDRRPDRAVIAYSNLIRRYFKNTRPIVLGGIEASLRRVTHYDFWSDSLRRSVLFDAKADLLVYGMGENAVLEIARKMKEGRDDYKYLRGVCYISKTPAAGYIELPSHEQCVSDKLKFIEMFDIFYKSNDSLTAKGLFEKTGDRYLIHNPPAPVLTSGELDEIYGLGYSRSVHPYYKKLGAVAASNTIDFSITTHRGCYGECNFCAIAVHQGRTVVSRGEKSIIKEAEKITRMDNFKGYITDAGGATANMYAIECEKKIKSGACKDKRCLYPKACRSLEISHKKQIALLKKLRGIAGVKKVFVASGIRYDMVLCDAGHGAEYIDEIARHHVSGQLKLAPEHTEGAVTALMGKPGPDCLVEFKRKFDDASKKAGKDQFLTYYLIAAHPGCAEGDMAKMKKFVARELKINPEQVQIFTPTPSTWSTLMYYTGINPFTKEKIFVEKGDGAKLRQKKIITG
ncbi:MAG TPA: YgiQ family radical SAM protein [Candidatus Wallbacteria bacterium]|nr:YgiQ family radical SAM protein [Candidatus Wallbacteria bacterium]